MSFKSVVRVLWLTLLPFDALQNAIGAFGFIINLLVSLGIPIGGGLASFYFPSANTQTGSHSWLLAIVIGLALFTVFVIVAATKLQSEKDKLNDISFTVTPRVLNNGAILEVTNDGQVASFRATARMRNDIHHESELFLLYWDGYGENVSLGNGDTRQITVARQSTITLDPHVIGLTILKATPEGVRSFNTATSLANAAYPWNPGMAYMEVTMKPISFSKRHHTAYYALEQPSITELKFYQVNFLPSASHSGDYKT
jgi:hypothetical protein